MRLDLYLSERNYCDSRTKAKSLIREGKVKVDGITIFKPSFDIGDQRVEVETQLQYVSRAGEKLALFLEEADLLIEGREVLDIGSSTGGFTEVLLRFGAASVTAVDVGTAQLHPSLKVDRRVISHEQTDIREFESKRPFSLVTCDVSFVGISHILPSIDRLSERDIILLFKPQFEVGREVKRDSRGVVKDREAIIRAQKRFEAECTKLDWHLIQMAESKVRGKEGNVEIFYHFAKR
ncbi:MAG: TlyA family rRNA (cytidine-2'-O)-methyltransferase [Campylobacteraceae bacterium 4484_4]|nr:MAG: TlyA family rRNA (cytidine-2'-O)-methyltransferase [Campylobacteraceae bacterium 4484_4]